MGGLVRFCIRRPVCTWATVLVLVLLGVSSYNQLAVSLLPKIDIPVVVVQTRYAGASPNEIEQLVTKPVEDSIADLEGLDKITSFSAESNSFVILEMEVDVDVDQALVDVSNKVKSARHKLPREIDEPVFRTPAEKIVRIRYYLLI